PPLIWLLPVSSAHPESQRIWGGRCCAERLIARRAAPALPSRLPGRSRSTTTLLHRDGRQRAAARYFYFEEEPGRRSAAKLLTRGSSAAGVKCSAAMMA